MKKKIGDLTLKEIRDIKHRCRDYNSCEECNTKNKLCYMVCGIELLINFDILEQEFEVEDESSK